MGWVRSSACTWLFSSTPSTTAPSGGFQCSPTMSRTFSPNNGSEDSLKFSTRWGCRPKACQIRTMAVCESPIFLAVCRVVQWVPCSGRVSKVARTTRSTCSSPIERGGARARLVLQASQPVQPEPLAPLAHGGLADVQPAGYLGVAQPRGAGQHDAGAQHQGLSALRAPSQLSQLLGLLWAQKQGLKETSGGPD
jgi:hypothetical protein